MQLSTVYVENCPGRALVVERCTRRTSGSGRRVHFSTSEGLDWPEWTEWLGPGRLAQARRHAPAGPAPKDEPCHLVLATLWARIGDHEGCDVVACGQIRARLVLRPRNTSTRTPRQGA